MGETMSDWVITGKKFGLEYLATDKFEDYERLIESGLPRFDDFKIHYKEFKKGNKGLKGFLAKHKYFTIRAIPNTKDIPRRYKVGVGSFDECQKFLEKNIQKGKEGIYSILITEHEPTYKSGIIISRDKDVLIEIGDFQLDELSHGRTPSAGCTIDLLIFGSINKKTTWHIQASLENKSLVKKALNCIKTGRNALDYNFMKGYFEFVVTEKEDKIKFLDFKINEMYLK